MLSSIAVDLERSRERALPMARQLGQLVGLPVLLVGPNVYEPCHMLSATLVACVDGSDHAEAALPVTVSWTRPFGGPRPWPVIGFGQLRRRPVTITLDA